MTTNHITITHTRAEGTLLDGSCKGDGVLDLVRPYGFRSFPSLRCLGIARSRDRAAQQWRIDGARRALEGAGWAVTVVINEGRRRSFEEAETGRMRQAEARAERYTGKSRQAQAASDAAHSVSDGIPMGQPILRGHHSAAQHHRDIARMDAGMRRSIGESKRAEHLADRARAAAGYEEFRTDPARTLRRIDKLEADRRRVARSLERCAPGSPLATELGRQAEELDEQIAHWRGVVAQAEAAGFKVWSRADFAKGDFARYRGIWYEVLRVNAKSLTIPHMHNSVGRKVVRKGDGRLDWTWTAGYHDGITGRMSAEEMARHLDGQGPKDHSE